MQAKGDKMLKYVASVLLLTLAVRSGSSFVFPDEVSLKYNIRSGYGEDGRGNRPRDYGHNHNPGASRNYHGNNGDTAPGFDNQRYDNRPGRPERPDYGGFGSQSQANAQSTGSGSSASSQSGSRFLNQMSHSAAQSQALSHGYQQGSSYPFGPSGGTGASSASSAASATSGIVNGVAVASASAAAAAAAAGSGRGDAASVSASSSSSSSGIHGGFDTGPGQIPPWYFQNRIAGEDANATNRNTDESSDRSNNATIVLA